MVRQSLNTWGAAPDTLGAGWGSGPLPGTDITKEPRGLLGKSTSPAPILEIEGVPHYRLSPSRASAGLAHPPPATEASTPRHGGPLLSTHPGQAHLSCVPDLEDLEPQWITFIYLLKEFWFFFSLF